MNQGRDEARLTAPSLMRMSAAARLSGALGLACVIWFCVWWAVR